MRVRVIFVPNLCESRSAYFYQVLSSEGILSMSNCYFSVSVAGSIRRMSFFPSSLNLTLCGAYECCFVCNKAYATYYLLNRWVLTDFSFSFSLVHRKIKYFRFLCAPASLCICFVLKAPRMLHGMLTAFRSAKRTRRKNVENTWRFFFLFSARAELCVSVRAYNYTATIAIHATQIPHSLQPASSTICRATPRLSDDKYEWTMNTWPRKTNRVENMTYDLNETILKNSFSRCKRSERFVFFCFGENILFVLMQ